MDIKDFAVGQKAYFYGGSIRSKGDAPLQEVTITKVGRKYVTAKGGWWERQFEPTYNAEVDRYLIEKVEIGTAGRLYATREDYEIEREADSLRGWLNKATNWSNVRTYTLEQLRAVKAILER